jgi:hypothetical protein
MPHCNSVRASQRAIWLESALAAARRPPRLQLPQDGEGGVQRQLVTAVAGTSKQLRPQVLKPGGCALQRKRV